MANSVMISQLPAAPSVAPGMELVGNGKAAAGGAVETQRFPVEQIAAIGFQTPLAVGASRAAALTDVAKWMRITGAFTLTIPADATVAFPIGTTLNGMSVGAAAGSIAAASGVTINGAAGFNKALSGQWASFGLVKVAANTWDAFGSFA